MDLNFDHQMSLSKSKCWYSYNCLHFLKRAVPLKKDKSVTILSMEQRDLKNVNNCLNTNIYSYLETSGGPCYNLYLNVIHFFNTSLN